MNSGVLARGPSWQRRRARNHPHARWRARAGRAGAGAGPLGRLGARWAGGTAGAKLGCGAGTERAARTTRAGLPRAGP
jgi:hypothetical protein